MKSSPVVVEDVVDVDDTVEGVVDVDETVGDEWEAVDDVVDEITTRERTRRLSKYSTQSLVCCD